MRSSDALDGSQIAALENDSPEATNLGAFLFSASRVAGAARRRLDRRDVGWHRQRMATKLAPKKKLPDVVYIWRNEDGMILAEENVDELPDGVHVGRYEIGSQYASKVTTSLEPVR